MTNEKRDSERERACVYLYCVCPCPRELKTDESKRAVADDAERAGDGPKERNSRPKAKSKVAAFVPERQLWDWLGPSFKKASKGKGRKEFYKAVHRGDEIIKVT